MNSFSGYLGLPNISYVTADDLDIANLSVDTITVNTQAKIDNIQPLTNTSSITVGTNTNTGVIDFQQDVDINADLEANNITTVGTIYTDNIQPVLSNSNLIIGTTTNTGILDVRQSATFSTNKNLTLQGTGKITTPNILVSGLTASKIVLTDASKNLVSSSYTDTDFARLTASNTFSGATNTFSGTIATNTISTNIPANAVSLFTNSTGSFTIGNSSSLSALSINQTISTNKGINMTSSTLTTNTIQAYNASALSIFTDANASQAITLGYASSVNPLNINLDTILNTNKNLTLQGTGKVTTPNILVSGLTASKMVLTDASKNLISSSYTDTDFARLAASNTFTGTSNTFNNKILCNTLTGTTTSSAMSLGEFGDTSNITFYKNINMGATRFITLQSDGTLYVNTITGTDASAAATLFSTQTGNINLGYSSSINPINLNCNTVLSTNKNLTLQGTGKVTTPNILVSGLTASKLVLTDASKNLISSSYTDTDFALKSGSTFTGTIIATEIQCPLYNSTNATTLLEIGKTNTTSNITLGSSQTSGNITLGNTLPASDAGTLTINKSTTLGSGKSITLTGLGEFITSATGDVKTNYLYGVNAGDTVRLYDTTTTGDIYLANGLSTGSLYIGIPGTTGTLQCRLNTVLASGKTLTMADATSKILSNYYDSRNPVTDLYIGNNLSSGTINLMGDVYTNTGKLISITDTGKLIVNTIEVFDATKNANLFTNLSGALTQINIGSTTIAGTIVNSDLFVDTTKALGCNNVYARGSSDLNIGTFTSSGYFINLTQNTKVSSGKYITCEKYDSINATTALAIGSTNTTASITVGGALTSGAISLGLIGMTGQINCNANVNIGTSASNKGIACNYYSSFNVSDLMRYSATSTTGNIRLGENQTSGTITLGNSTAATDTGTLTINKSTTLGAAKDLTMSSTGIIKTFKIDSLASNQNIQVGPAITTANILMGVGLTTGNIAMGQTTGDTTGECEILMKLNQGRNFTSGSFDLVNNWINCGFGDATNPKLFSGAALVNKYLTTTMYASAPASRWSCFESDAAGEGSAFIQNGDTSCIINPGDFSCLWWLDEDVINTSPAGSTTYAWSGWKLSTGAVFTLSSDRRLKRDITPIVDTTILDKLQQLQMVNFKWKAPTEDRYYKNGVLRRKYQEVHTGYIAQDVKQIFPDCVERENTEAYWTLKREDLNAKYNLGVQALIKQNIEQQAKIDSQQVEIDDLKARLTRLEQLILNP